MRRYHYDPSKYRTYLEQLGITYPTERARMGVVQGSDAVEVVGRDTTPIYHAEETCAPLHITAASKPWIVRTTRANQVGTARWQLSSNSSFPFFRQQNNRHVILSDAHASALGEAPSCAIRASRRTCFFSPE